jgi:hypothetical protein
MIVSTVDPQISRITPCKPPTSFGADGTRDGCVELRLPLRETGFLKSEGEGSCISNVTWGARRRTHNVKSHDRWIVLLLRLW